MLYVIRQFIDPIKQDPRHKNVTELTRDYISERQFEDWSMGFEELSERN